MDPSNPNAAYWLYPQPPPPHHGQAVPQRHVLPQEPYTSPSHTTSPIALQHAPILFVVGGTPGIRVADALQENYHGLLHADEPVALPEPIGVKITFRINVIGYPRFEKQKYIRAVADNSPITYGRLARRAAEAISDFIQEMARRNVQPEPGAVRFGNAPGCLRMEDLYIDLLDQRSKGSFQPRITYWA